MSLGILDMFSCTSVGILKMQDIPASWSLTDNKWEHQRSQNNPCSQFQEVDTGCIKRKDVFEGTCKARI